MMFELTKEYNASDLKKMLEIKVEINFRYAALDFCLKDTFERFFFECGI